MKNGKCFIMLPVAYLCILVVPLGYGHNVKDVHENKNEDRNGPIINRATLTLSF